MVHPHALETAYIVPVDLSEGGILAAARVAAEIAPFPGLARARSYLRPSAEAKARQQQACRNQKAGTGP